MRVWRQGRGPLRPVSPEERRTTQVARTVTPQNSEGHAAASRRIAVVSRHLTDGVACPIALAPTSMDKVSFMQQELRAAKKEIWDLLEDINCNPILIRAAWHDSGTYDKSIPSWPACGGANGSIRFDPELKHGANAGLVKAVTVYLKPIKSRHQAVSWADLLQLASATAVEHAKGPRIDMVYGRVDVASEADCPPEGRLPGAAPPFGDSAPDAASHIRNVFYRMGFNDQEIVALSGAHTLGRAFKERSGTVPYGYGAASGTTYTSGSVPARPDGKPLVGMAGGQSWTKNWLTFDNSYFSAKPTDDPLLLRLSTDACLYTDPGFKPHYLRYAASQDVFFREYAAAHKKLSELGSAYFPTGGIRI